MEKSERNGLVAALVSSALGGCAGALTRYVVGGAASFYLWVYALERTTPTRVTNTMTINPVSASLLAAFLIGEPLGLSLALGIVAVGTGIWIASTAGR